MPCKSKTLFNADVHKNPESICTKTFIPIITNDTMDIARQ